MRKQFISHIDRIDEFFDEVTLFGAHTPNLVDVVEGVHLCDA